MIRFLKKRAFGKGWIEELLPTENKTRLLLGKKGMYVHGLYYLLSIIENDSLKLCEGRGDAN